MPGRFCSSATGRPSVCGGATGKKEPTVCNIATPGGLPTVPSRAAFRERVLQLIRAKYSGSAEERFGPTLAAEHLAEEDGLSLDEETLRRWMLGAGLWSRQRGRKRAHLRRRLRKEHFGELVQLDGSFHASF